MQPISPQELEARIDARYRVFLILWAAILMSVLFLSALAMAIPAQTNPNPALNYALLAIGLMMIVISLVMRQRMMQKALEKSSLADLQTAHIVGIALCESAALFGLVDHFTAGSNISWFLMAASALGLLLHFPRKEQVRAASEKPTIM